MSNKLFVAKLPFNFTEEDLQNLFSEVGEVVSAKIIIDKETRRSRGFGFVEMKNEDDAKKAISEFNGKQIDGRELVVNEARERN
jgi:RNA recognition motif-containing protein